jgi:hypothetical protein
MVSVEHIYVIKDIKSATFKGILEDDDGWVVRDAGISPSARQSLDVWFEKFQGSHVVITITKTREFGEEYLLTEEEKQQAHGAE